MPIVPVPRIMILLFAAVLTVTGCATHPPAAEQETAATDVTPPPALTEQEMKKIVVARVNGAEIYMNALEKMTDIMSASIAPPRTEPREATREKALNELIFQELALQEASRQNMRVMERQINRAVAGLKMHDQSNLDDYLKSRHMTLEELRAELKRNLLFQRIFEQEVSEKVSIPEEDIRKEYESHQDRYKTPEGQLSYEKTREIVAGQLRSAAQRERRRSWEQELRKDAKIEIVEAGDRSQK